MNELKKFQDEHYYNELTNEEINYQLEMSDPYEFSYHYAKYLQHQLQAYKEKEENLINIVSNKIIIDYDIDTPLKDALNKANLKILSLTEALTDYKDKEYKLRAELENFHTQFEIDETISVHHLKSKKRNIRNCKTTNKKLFTNTKRRK